MDELSKKLKAAALSTWQFSVDRMEIDLFEYYAAQSETTLLKMEKQTKRPRKNYDIENQIVAYRYFSERIRHSQIVYLATLIEKHLSEVCTYICASVEDDFPTYSLSDLRGDKWINAKNMMRKYGRINIENSVWKRIEDIYTIRNSIAHDNCEVCSKSQTEKIKSVKNRSIGISLTSYKLGIDQQYVSSALSTVKEFIAFTITSLPNNKTI